MDEGAIASGANRPGVTGQPRVLIVDDNAQVRRELRTLLTLAAGISVVGEAADGAQGVRLALALRPDVVLMDLEMPAVDGCEATRQIKAACPACRVVFLTAYGDPSSLEQATRAGADAFLLKGASLEILIKTMTQREE